VRRAVVVAAVLVALAGCDKDKKSGGGKAGSAAVQRKPVDAATAGTVDGVVKFEGKPKAARKLELATPECKAAHPEGVEVPIAAVSDGKLANAFVYVKQGLEAWSFDAPKGEVVIDQKGCMYDPYVTGVQVGQKLVFLNSDAFNHNINGQPKENTAFNVAMPQKGMRVEKVFEETEVMFKVKCDVHPWMLGWVGVVDHPHFKVTAADGAFSFKGLPPGDYTVAAWHEVYGEQTAKVTLAAKESKSVALTFKE
jgi:plastocyanin